MPNMTERQVSTTRDRGSRAFNWPYGCLKAVTCVVLLELCSGLRERLGARSWRHRDDAQPANIMTLGAARRPNLPCPTQANLPRTSGTATPPPPFRPRPLLKLPSPQLFDGYLGVKPGGTGRTGS